MQNLAAISAILTAFTALASLTTAWFVVRLDSQRSKSDVFLRLSSLMDADEMRRKRHFVYLLDRDSYPEWTSQQQSDVDDLLACLDLSLTLYKAGAINRKMYMYMFGDVTFRVIFQTVPYCNSQVKVRGDQFLAPVRMALPGLVSEWRRLARRNRFPLQLMVSRESRVTITPDSFEGDADLKRFSHPKYSRRRRWRLRSVFE